MLSAVITVWNEEQRLTRALDSISGLVDETVVVIDEATTDSSIQVAKKHGCQIFTHPHRGYVEPLRNFSISKAKGDWILLLDADEEVSAGLAKRIPQLIANPGVSYYRIPRQNFIFGKQITSTHWWPDYTYRLFKKGTVIWSDQIHSIPITTGQGVDLPASPDTALVHTNYSTIDEYLEQITRYTKFQTTGKFIWTDIIAKPADEFITQYFARGGFKEGLHGLALALLQASSELILYLRAWEKTKFQPQDLSVSEVSQQLSVKINDFRWWSWPSYLRPLIGIIRKLGL